MDGYKFHNVHKVSTGGCKLITLAIFICFPSYAGENHIDKEGINERKFLQPNGGVHIS